MISIQLCGNHLGSKPIFYQPDNRAMLGKSELALSGGRRLVLGCNVSITTTS